MGEVQQTNGDRIAPAVSRVKAALAERLAWACDHPDEVAVAILPVIAVAWATRKHPLTRAEDFIAFEVGYWCGEFALQQYQQWKARPARPSPREVV